MATRDTFKSPILSALVGATVVVGVLAFGDGTSVSVGSGDPNGTTCSAGSLYLRTDSVAAYQCSGGSAWSQLGGAAGDADPAFGAGIDGAVNFNGGAVTNATLVGNVYTLTKPKSATDCNFDAAYIVEEAGYIITCSGTISGAGKIRNNGSPGTSVVSTAENGLGGAGAVGSFFNGGTAGGNGAINDASSAGVGVASAGANPLWHVVGQANGGAAGAAGGGGGGSTATGFAPVGGKGGNIPSVAEDSYWPQFQISGRQVGGALFGKSTGGGGGMSPHALNGTCTWVSGCDGSGGGGGGGWVVVTAKRSTFTGTIEAKGGAGGAGFSWDATAQGCPLGGYGGGGGGGGGGGTIVFIYGTGTLPTFDVSGGAGGVGGTVVNGTDPTEGNRQGGTGGAGGAGKVITYRLGAS